MASERDAYLGGPELTGIRMGPRLSQEDASEYIAEFADELASLARSVDLPMLAYLLEVAALEAKTQMHELAGAPRQTSC